MKTTDERSWEEYTALLRLLLQAARYVRDAVWLKLAVCMIIDTVGLASFLLPGIGEFGDVVWAPLQAILLLFMFGSRIGIIGFFEEIVPGLDFVPSACIAWGCENIEAPLPWLNELRALTGVQLRRRR